LFATKSYLALQKKYNFNLKKILTIVLIVLIMLPNFGNIVVYFSFKINQKEIARTLCIQKDLVQNTCNGRCVLETKLKKLEQNQKTTETNLKEKADIQYVMLSVTQTEKLEWTSKCQTKIFFKDFGKPKNKILTIYHPPTV